MRLEPPFLIAESKLTNYLLISLLKNDKSTYLKLAGYSLNDWPILEKDLLSLVQTGEASVERITEYGDSFSVTDILMGPNGNSLAVKTIWMKETKTGFTKFITLYPP